MGSSSSVAQHKSAQQLAKSTPQKNQEEVKMSEENQFNQHNKKNQSLLHSNTHKKKSILVSNKDADSQQNQDEISIKQRIKNKHLKDSLSDLDESEHSKQDFSSRTDNKACNNSNIFANPKKNGLTHQNTLQSPSQVYNQKDNQQKQIQPAQQQEKRLFGDFYVSPIKIDNNQRAPTYLANFNIDELNTATPKEDQQKKKKQNVINIEEKKSPGIEFESKNIVEIKDRNQNFFTKGNVVLSVNHYSNYNTQKTQDQEEFQTELLKQIVELGIQPTEYILDNAIKQEYEDKKNLISDFEVHGSKNQKTNNGQKVQIIIYPGFHEIFQNKSNQKKTAQLI
ncbi:hypothetical protein TTHERM_00171800 (macronuclear) [Tetrahymena thermophila SB210]|uniref:Uncharacterized protein n=1 Tax=Tetrahymena thermophila (strain SB210) TaxID=312017 RepID=Q22TE5_TETTS|nr:hypothetical protein TTHERM_00171800 [Tetrahymena thermophila SB210]EAR88493.1 hypothetical protein TTHERM_00171800 [Tetrahymena thermophila SB210]|eukprot:XP_001008738.1 hypothetical protein TTHERM_00171800 [Tetrahymena thermophila SB210]